MSKFPEISDYEIEAIHVYGARVHNLKNVDVRIPRNKLVVMTGISGSGKSSLAFDTLYAEGQRRYLESFSSYARQFIGNLERPDVDKITGLSPVISIEQKSTTKNPRSTVGTVTEIYDFMRLLFARAGDAFSYETGKQMVRYTQPEIVDNLLDQYYGKKVVILAPLVTARKGHYRELFERMRKMGYLRIRVDGEIEELREKMQVDRYKTHDIELVVDRIKVENNEHERLRASVETALRLGKGNLMILDYETEEIRSLSEHLMCPDTGISYGDPSPNTFSFNSPYGACPRCKGLGVVYEIAMDTMISDENKSINEGGIAPLGELRDNYAFRQLRKLAPKKNFNLSIPVRDIPADAMNFLLYGNEDGIDNSIDEDEDTSGRRVFEGVIPMIRRCFRETSSDNLRRWAETFMERVTCPECEGTRLKKESRHFKVGGADISELANMDVDALHNWFSEVEERLSERQKLIARDVIKELQMRLGFLLQVGLDYLTLNRPARSLSGGESQRIRLATQIGSQLTGITYILDEPSIGLHQRDNHRLILALRELTDVGNTVLVVEHDKDIMLEADYLIDLGPGAGAHGGEVVAEGKPEQFKQFHSLTADYLSDRKHIPIPEKRREGNGQHVVLFGAEGNNLKSVDAAFPLSTMICVTGVSGSGKSTLINRTLYPILRQNLYRSKERPMSYRRIEGLDLIDKVIEIDQSPIGRTPRSNPATYIGVFTEIRNLFAQMPESKIRGYKVGRFSFNVKGGRCDVCEGGGVRVIEMNFLPDVYVQCEKCLGRRYNRETLEIRFKGKSISDVLDMTIEESVEFFKSIPKIHRKVKTLLDVGLGYVKLGQAATTLSGGEAQRVKLAAELSKKDTGQTFYILDEPTTGLHFEDIAMLMKVLQKLVDKGNTVLIIEHNMDVVKMADHIIDLGPEGGHKGGEILCTGTPEEVAKHEDSHTGRFLKMELGVVKA